MNLINYHEKVGGSRNSVIINSTEANNHISLTQMPCCDLEVDRMSKFTYPRMRTSMRISAREPPLMRTSMRTSAREPPLMRTSMRISAREPPRMRTSMRIPAREALRMRIFVTFLNNTSY